ncbi:hypothetical protein NDU88_006018 [Pleurodeles waltl]|uniref:ribonuclease H n=1 Tax=Pleurodeles waltl TaxID=8319 RepID=A0AAV7NP54_PLEWA|nr:hypothetical protein NDU88_006018 [Pleurodeles waltl]
MALLHEEVNALFAKGAIERVPASEVGHGCYFRYFLVPKKDKGLRPILDLWSLDLFLKKEKFKMLTFAQVLSALDPGDWMVSELQDTYLHIPVLPAHRCYLRFVVGNKHFQFTVLPFGLTSSPWVFTKVMVVVAAHLRRLGVPVFPYLDDWLLKADTPQKVVSHLQTMANLFHSLGFTINMPKSHLTPSQMLPFLGAVLDTVQLWAYPPKKLVQHIWAMIPVFQPLSWILVRMTLGLLGLMASCILLLQKARWHMRALQLDLKFQWVQHQGRLSDKVQISEETAKDLQWWLTNQDLFKGRSLSFPQPDLTVVTDASLLRWGGHMGEAEIRGLCSPANSGLHINLLELCAIRLALKAFLLSLSLSKGKQCNCSRTTPPPCGTATNKEEWGVMDSLSRSPLSLDLAGTSGHFPGD